MLFVSFDLKFSHACVHLFTSLPALAKCCKTCACFGSSSCPANAVSNKQGDIKNNSSYSCLNFPINKSLVLYFFFVSYSCTLSFRLFAISYNLNRCLNFFSSFINVFASHLGCF